MEELWKYYSEEEWNYFKNHVVSIEFKNNIEFYKKIQKTSPFNEEINKALSVLSSTLFQKNENNFVKWLKTPIPALNNKSPEQISKAENGSYWIKTYLLRC